MRRSGASFDQKQPDPLTFFLDRNLGKHIIADILREAGARVAVHDDHFPTDAKDNEWLPAVGKNGWVVLTKDKRIKDTEGWSYGRLDECTSQSVCFNEWKLTRPRYGSNLCKGITGNAKICHQ